MAETVEKFRRNNTLDAAILEAAQTEGMGWFGCFRLRLALRRMTDDQHAELERFCTQKLLDAGVTLPAGASVVGGVLVGEWGDGTIIRILIDALPQILDFLSKLLPLIFGLFAVILLTVFLSLPATASAQCSGGVCRIPRVTVERKVERTVTVERPVVRVLQPVRRVVHRERFLFWRPALRHGG